MSYSDITSDGGMDPRNKLDDSMYRHTVKPHDHPDFVGGWVWTKLEMRWIDQRIADAVAAEREACDSLVEAAYIGFAGDDHTLTVIRRAIQARGQR